MGRMEEDIKSKYIKRHLDRFHVKKSSNIYQAQIMNDMHEIIEMYRKESNVHNSNGAVSCLSGIPQSIISHEKCQDYIHRQEHFIKNVANIPKKLAKYPLTYMNKLALLQGLIYCPKKIQIFSIHRHNYAHFINHQQLYSSIN